MFGYMCVSVALTNEIIHIWWVEVDYPTYFLLPTGTVGFWPGGFSFSRCIVRHIRCFFGFSIVSTLEYLRGGVCSSCACFLGGFILLYFNYVVLRDCICWFRQRRIVQHSFSLYFDQRPQSIRFTDALTWCAFDWCILCRYPFPSFLYVVLSRRSSGASWRITFVFHG